MDNGLTIGMPAGIAIPLLLFCLAVAALGSMGEKAFSSGVRPRDGSKELFRLRGLILLGESGALLVMMAFLWPVLWRLAKSWNFPVPGLFAAIVLLFGAAFLILVLGELFPKKWAAQRPQTAYKAALAPSRALIVPLRPFLWLVQGTVNLLLRITGLKVHLEDEDFSEEEVMSMLETGQEKGALKEEGKKMIDSIFAFDDIFAYEIMTPRTEVFAIDINDTPDKYLDALMELKYSRIPVYDDDSDNIIGILHIKDYLIKARESGFEHVDLRSILRKPFFVPDTKYIDTLFFELQKTRQHIAVLIDEYGGFSGIVTLEDIIEEVMGNIDDEYDEEIPKIEPLGKDAYRIDGALYLDDINDQLGTDLESENIETLGGLLIEILGEIPEDGSHQTRIRQGKYEFVIESVRDRRIESVMLRIDKEADGGGDHEETPSKETP